KMAANGNPNRKRTWVAPTVPSAFVSSRCVALRTVCAAAAITVKMAHSQGETKIMRLCRHDRAFSAIQIFVVGLLKPACGRANAGTTGTFSLSFGSLCCHHVIDVHVVGKLPSVGQQVVDHSALANYPQAAEFECNLELVRSNELIPAMGAARQPTEHV